MAGANPAMTGRWGGSEKIEDVVSNKAGFLDEAFQPQLLPRPDMADDFGGAQAADLAANRERQAAGQPVQKAGGVEVAGPGRIDDPLDRRGGNPVRLVAADDDAPRAAAGQRGDLDMAAHRLRRRNEVAGLVKRADLGLVGEQDVDLAGDQLAEGGAVTLDAKRVGKAQRDAPPGL